MWLVTSTIKDSNGEFVDNWTTHETEEEALNAYKRFLYDEEDWIHSANISEITKSTEPHHEKSFSWDIPNTKLLLL